MEIRIFSLYLSKGYHNEEVILHKMKTFAECIFIFITKNIRNHAYAYDKDEIYDMLIYN